MIGRVWRRLYRWAHDRYGAHTGVFIAKYGRVCDKCHLPVRWNGDGYQLRTPFTRNPTVGTPSLTRIPRSQR